MTKQPLENFHEIEFKKISSGEQQQSALPFLTKHLRIFKVEKMTVELSQIFELLVDRVGNLWTGELGCVCKYDFTRLRRVKYPGGWASGLALHPVDKQFIYATNTGGCRIYKIDMVTKEKQEVLQGCRFPRSLSFTSTGDMYMLYNVADALVSKYTVEQLADAKSTVQPAVETAIENQLVPWSVKVNPNNDNEVFVSFHQSHSVVKLVDNKVSTTWDLYNAENKSTKRSYNDANGMDFYNGQLLVVNCNRIRVIDMKSGTMSTLDVELPSKMTALAVDPKQRAIYVSDNSGKSIYKLHFVDTTDFNTLFNQVPLRCPTDITIQ